jgi:hypothetical protein
VELSGYAFKVGHVIFEVYGSAFFRVLYLYAGVPLKGAGSYYVPVLPAEKAKRPAPVVYFGEVAIVRNVGRMRRGLFHFNAFVMYNTT